MVYHDIISLMHHVFPFPRWSDYLFCTSYRVCMPFDQLLRCDCLSLSSTCDLSTKTIFSIYFHPREDSRSLVARCNIQTTCWQNRKNSLSSFFLQAEPSWRRCTTACFSAAQNSTSGRKLGSVIRSDNQFLN